MNPFGGNAFGGAGGFPQQFSGGFPQQGFQQFGSGGGFSSGGSPFPGGNAFPAGTSFPGGNAFPGGNSFPGSVPFSSAAPFQGSNVFSGAAPFQGGNAFSGAGSFPPPPSGFSAPPIGGQFGQGFGFPQGADGFGYQASPFAPQFPPGEVPPSGNQSYFGSGSYGRPRSRRSSRHRSKSRRRKSTSSSSDDAIPRRGSPFGGPGIPYANLQPFPDRPPLSPRGGSPVFLPQRPAW